jgi:hypothetical protein
MTPNPELISLAKQGNSVAELVNNLLATPYPETPLGYKLALDAGFSGAEALLSQAKQSPLPLSLTTGPASSRYSSLLNQAGIVGQIWPGKILGVQNTPGPLASMVTLGLLGAGLGHVGGSALDRFTGENLDRKRKLRRLGAAVGMIPGVMYAAANVAGGKPMFSGRIMNLPHKYAYVKTAMVIPTERLQDMIWNDPYVANRLPLHMTAQTSALIEGASRTANNELPVVTPGDVANMAVGLGSGYASGLVVGKTLGALFGVSDRSQEILRRSGAAAGLIRSVVPLVFGQ